MTRYIIPCTYCREPQERTLYSPIVTCFACKRKRLKLTATQRSNNRMKRSRAIIRYNSDKMLEKKQWALKLAKIHKEKCMLAQLG